MTGPEAFGALVEDLWWAAMAGGALLALWALVLLLLVLAGWVANRNRRP